MTFIWDASLLIESSQLKTEKVSFDVYSLKDLRNTG